MKFFRLNLALLCLTVLWGCSKTTPPTLNPSEADQKFLKIMKKESPTIAPILKTIGQTLWIYIPRKRGLLMYKAKEHAGTEETKKQRNLSLEYVDGRADDKNFFVEYDIFPRKKTSKDNGLTSGSTKGFIEDYQRVFSVISRVYFNAQTPPRFIVVVFADIISGIEIIDTSYLEDYKRYQTSALPYEEYMLREQSETKGNPTIVNDAAGDHINYHDLSWGDFLIKQIVKRIEFKYQQSDFEPTEDTQGEILKIVKQTFDAYHFEDFNTVELRDLHDGMTRSFGQAILNNLDK